MSDLFDLSGKTALVTGARRGIGAGMALALAEAGADIIGASAQMEVDGGEVGQRIRDVGRKFTGHAVNFADRGALKAFAAKMEQEPIDILVNNAGTIKRQPAAEHPEEWWDEVIETNLSAQFLLTQAVGRGMIARGRGGKVIFTASLLTFQGGINVPGYAASKGGVGQLVMAFANEWAPKGINVNAIAPGYIATDNTEALRADPDRSAAILGRIPAGRWGTPEDFGGPAVFLASKASDYVSGTILTVDGGWMGR
ncbi:2-deoxy-D-gluconate 3-dehydrogenase [Rubellimicrobium mesophilum DSM 19309]|uniref:2-deoxy-D-gluconate 3-dehydrogenase n=1 Tax=Rubellimicrobium mesophilum DSM 19309 TaxID=442562 RepID=A0A017HPK1_9RHOB|nr:SDR family oxidoreductase [Rubellimicrobium mesophilum]EYD75694.1 2-deoxy-D-gluconate 3-dehydrogenase [Rubellimicrobium mesophilum DSM 19309]